MSSYLAIDEHGDDGWSADVPDLPGCDAAGATREIVEANLRSALALHLDGLRAEGLPIPAPQSVSGHVAA